MGNRILKKLLEEDSMKNYEWKPWQSAGVKPEYQPRRAFGTRAVDWQKRKIGQVADADEKE
jgi:hypothetical protein